MFSRPKKVKAKKRKQAATKNTGKETGDRRHGEKKDKTSGDLAPPQELVRGDMASKGTDEPTVLDDTKETEEERDFKRGMLNFFNDAADFHEHIRR